MPTLKKTHWQVPASDFARKTYNPLVTAFMKHIDAVAECDKPMISVSVGDPTLFGNLLPPSCVEESISKTLKDKNAFTNPPPGGFQFAREAIAKYASIPGELEVSSKNVYITSGCSSAIEIALRVLSDANDNILIPCPGFTLYGVLSRHRDVEIREYRLLPEQSWNVDLDHLESLIDDRTKLIVVVNPSNPCGSVYSKDHLEDIIKVAEKHRIPILADEIYEYISFPENQFYPLGAVSKSVPILTCTGLAKRFNVPGWRCGWLVVHDRNGILAKEVIPGIESLLEDFYSCCSIIQILLPSLLVRVTGDYFKKTISLVKKNANLLYDELIKIDGIKPIMPGGSMYMMVGIDVEKFNDIDDDETWSLLLIKEQAMTVMPCSPLGCPNFVRISLTPPYETMLNICQRLTEFCVSHKRA
ncbi:uncharacterized protein TRIADDRAFT_33190 [Trichoplax adhaerens]|uniref:Tyrosine aminotransferase n=1 Tax=Trichoplax adhaerens TaxID=10228 RepID=B3SCB8_TRIAD|nr:hypothetical protein TRIADDRAFT_33190 [Trichoplax adhaerens]EDV19635.1 hypothetical protein TRIADDRAFT_33190 [Trichoplax adhaerens]|eukprot:XP_002117873.1 hypothetical protein TRIADDRAFT_33190 [Trichoplax adhaerens]